MQRHMMGLGIVLSVALCSASGIAAQGRKPPKQRVTTQTAPLGTLGITGLPSSALQCVTGGSSNVHSIGFVPQGARVTVTFSSDFNPVAAITIVQLGSEAPDSTARASFVADDDTGGNMEPEIRWTAPYPGTLALFVKPFAADEAGCYLYKVEVQVPS